MTMKPRSQRTPPPAPATTNLNGSAHRLFNERLALMRRFGPAPTRPRGPFRRVMAAPIPIVRGVTRKTTRLARSKSLDLDDSSSNKNKTTAPAQHLSNISSFFQNKRSARRRLRMRRPSNDDTTGGVGSDTRWSSSPIKASGAMPASALVGFTCVRAGRTTDDVLLIGGTSMASPSTKPRSAAHSFGANIGSMMPRLPLFKFRPATGEWEDLTDLVGPSANCGISGIVAALAGPAHDAVLICGGFDSRGNYGSPHILDLASDPPRLERARLRGGRSPGRMSDAAAVSDGNGSVVIFGGLVNSGFSNDVLVADFTAAAAAEPVEAAEPDTNNAADAAAPAAPAARTGQWRRPEISGVPPEPRAHHTAVRVNTSMLIFGGQGKDRAFYDVRVLDLESFTWSRPAVKGNCPLECPSSILPSFRLPAVVLPLPGGRCDVLVFSKSLSPAEARAAARKRLADARASSSTSKRDPFSGSSPGGGGGAASRLRRRTSLTSPTSRAAALQNATQGAVQSDVRLDVLALNTRGRKKWNGEWRRVDVARTVGTPKVQHMCASACVLGAGHDRVLFFDGAARNADPAAPFVSPFARVPELFVSCALPWACERLLWLVHLKPEEQTNTVMSALSAVLIRWILSFINSGMPVWRPMRKVESGSSRRRRSMEEPVAEIPSMPTSGMRRERSSSDLTALSSSSCAAAMTWQQQ